MNQLRVLSLMTLILLSASRLPGQSLGPNPRPCLSHSVPSTCKVIYVQPVVCNDGTISIYVVRAYMDVGFFSGHEPWVIEGWYEVEPGKCSKIGPEQRYTNNKMFGVGYDAVTLLAFADARGAVKVPVGEAYEPSNQQLCVLDGDFRYVRDSEQSDLPRECDRAPAGSYLISASVAFYGYTFRPDDYPSDRDYLHVKLGPNDRAIPLGKQTSSGGASQTSSGAGSSQSGGDASPSLCGKVSCWDLFVQGVKQATRDNEAQRAANTNGPRPSQPSINPPTPPPPAAPPTSTADDDDPIGQGGFVTRPSNPTPAPARAYSLQWVRADVLAYIEASKTGFAAYKEGDVQVSQDYRMWDSSVKPSAARGCWVVQGTTATTLSCALSQRGDLNGLRPYYADLNKEIAATLPRDWTQVERPFGGDLPNQGYRSSSGAHLEVWIAPTESAAMDEIHFQLVSAH